MTVSVAEDTRLQLLPPQMLAEMDGGSVLCSPGELAGWFHKRSFACLLGQPVMAYGTQPKRVCELEPSYRPHLVFLCRAGELFGLLQ